MRKFNPKTYAKFMDKNFATDYLTDTYNKNALKNACKIITLTI